MSAIWIFVILQVIGTTLIAATLALASHWLKYRHRGLKRAIVTALIWLMLSLLLTGPMLFVIDAIFLALFLFFVNILLEIAAIWLLMKTTIPRAAGGWGLTAVTRGLWLAVILLAVRGRLTEGYVAPTGSMVPTIFNEHYIDKCPVCGGELIVDGSERSLQYFAQFHTISGICLNCRRETELHALPGAVQHADHFIVTKFLHPERWDLITFHHGREISLKRVVGMPGEEVRIDVDGHVLINGADIGAPPDSPGKLFRWPEHTDSLMMQPGSSQQLGPEEYFVLGDLSEHSLDSRFFGPVKGKDLDGVVTWIYWPLERMRIVR